MADTVRFLMEEMIPELEDLEERGYFSPAELKQIVNKRVNFEYLLKRRAPLKVDFMRYILYEKRLEELRLVRKDEMGLEGGNSLAEYAIVRRVHYIYQRATRKFRSDLSIWTAWLQYCRDTKSTRRMSKVVTKALQLHPMVPGLWIAAAEWEFEDNRNVAAARALMQRGLRLCKAAERLWAEYFRLELAYTRLLRARRAVLGIDEAHPEARVDMAPGTAMSHRSVHATGGAAEEAELGGAPAVEAATVELEAAAQDPDTPDAALEALLRGAVPRAVLRGAATALPGSLSLRRACLAALDEAHFPGTEDLENDIYQDLERNFARDEEAWDLRARRCVAALGNKAAADVGAGGGNEGGAAAAWEVYDQALNTLPTQRMFEMAAAFLTERLERLAPSVDIGTPPARLAGPARTPAKQLAALYARAAAAGPGVAPEALMVAWPPLALRLGKPQAALEAAAAACAAAPTSPAVLRQRLLLTARHAQVVSEQDATPAMHNTLVRLAVDAATSAPLKAAPALWDMGVGTLRALGAPLDGLLTGMSRALLGASKGPLQGGMGAAAAAVLRGTADQGLPVARAFYRPLLAGPPPGGAFFHAVLDLELAALPAERLPDASLRQLFEAAVDAYGSVDTAMWLRYVKYDMAANVGVGSVYWRATKALANPAAFIEACQASKAS